MNKKPQVLFLLLLLVFSDQFFAQKDSLSPHYSKVTINLNMGIARFNYSEIVGHTLYSKYGYVSSTNSSLTSVYYCPDYIHPQVNFDIVWRKHFKASWSMEYQQLDFSTQTIDYNYYALKAYYNSIGKQDSSAILNTKTEKVKDHIQLRNICFSIGFGYHQTINNWLIDADIVVKKMTVLKAEINRENYSSRETETLILNQNIFPAPRFYGGGVNVKVSKKISNKLYWTSGLRYTFYINKLADTDMAAYGISDLFNVSIKNYNSLNVILGLSLLMN